MIRCTKVSIYLYCDNSLNHLMCDLVQYNNVVALVRLLGFEAFKTIIIVEYHYFGNLFFNLIYHNFGHMRH